MRRRLFDELTDMQAEANAFFDEVYNRLSMFDSAMAGWKAREPEQVEDFISPQGTFERAERHWTNRGGRMITERYERQIYISSDSPQQIEPYHAAPPLHQLNHSTLHRLPPAEQTALPSGLPESQEGILARIEISTLRPGDVEITVNDNGLTITGKVYRKIMLPPGVDTSQVHAVYRDGVLEIRSAQPKHARKVEVIFE